ncbi:unnamed protein product, partial [Amoebophrya sp. A120]|eukprot:GSA120T00025974001.1
MPASPRLEAVSPFLVWRLLKNKPLRRVLAQSSRVRNSLNQDFQKRVQG